MRNLAKPYINRPLEKHERKKRLLPNKPAPIPVAWPQMSVIRMNSTYLECVDYYFERKGMGTFLSFMMLIPLVYAPLSIIFRIIGKWPDYTGSDRVFWLGFAIIFVLAFGLLAAVVIYFLRLDCFNYTHYPIRFNRKTRMVHAFLPWENGKILSIPWEDVFFVPTSEEHDSEFAIHGHLLSEDKKTVLDSFLLPIRSDWDSEYRYLQWEFIRQYMTGDEKKLAELTKMVGIVMNVGDRRERPFASFYRVFASLGGIQHPLTSFFFSPLIVIGTIGRIIAMWSGKIPRWPAEIEATCQYSPDDPYLRDGKHLTPRKEMPAPDVSQYAGK